MVKPHTRSKYNYSFYGVMLILAISKVTMDLSPRNMDDAEGSEIEIDEVSQEYEEKDGDTESKASNQDCDVSVGAAETDYVPVLHIPSDSANSDHEPSTGAKKRKPQKTTKLQVSKLSADDSE